MNRPWWKVPAGLVFLLLGFALVSIFLAVVLPHKPHEDVHLSVPAFIAAPLVLLGWPCAKRGTVIKAVYLLFTGILPGIVLLKGWEAVLEGFRPTPPPRMTKP